MHSIYKDFKGVQFDSNGNLIGPDANVISETYFDSNKYIDAFNRITGMNHVKRSGDIVLIMKDETGDVNQPDPTANRYTTGVACKSWHGSLNRSDSYVPLILSYPGGNTSEIKTIIDTPSVCPGVQCKGNWKVTDMIKAIIKQQYSPN